MKTTQNLSVKSRMHHAEHQLRRASVLRVLYVHPEGWADVEVTRYKNGDPIASYKRRLKEGDTFELEVAMNFTFEEAYKELG